MDIVGLSEMRRPGNGGINSGDYTNYWSGQSNGTQLRGVAIATPSQLQMSVVVVTLADKRMMPVRLKHTLGFLSLIAVYAPTEMHKSEEKGIY